MSSHGSNADVIGNGYVLSEFLNSASFSGSRDAAETTTFKKKSKTYIPGMKDTTLSFEGIYEGGLDQVDQVLEAALNVEVSGLFSYFPNGQEVVGRYGYTMDAIETSYEINTDLGEVAAISGEMNSGDKGVFRRGRVLSPMGVKGAAGNSASLDGGAATNNGGSLVVHTTAAADLSVKLQDSADNATWADLAGAIVVPNGRSSTRLIHSGTIRRYTRVLWAGSGTFMAIFERN